MKRAVVAVSLLLSAGSAMAAEDPVPVGYVIEGIDEQTCSGFVGGLVEGSGWAVMKPCAVEVTGYNQRVPRQDCRWLVGSAEGINGTPSWISFPPKSAA